MNNQELFVVKDLMALRALPTWLKKRSYSVVRYGLYDRNNTALVGLMDSVNNTQSKSGLICVYDEKFLASVVKICEEVNTGNVKVIGNKNEFQSEEYDLRRDFLSLLAENEALMPDHAALSVTCTQLGITEDEGYDILHSEPPPAVVVRRAA